MIDRIAWGLLALIHAAPALALFRPAMIGQLYGVGSSDSAYLLLHHRAALFLVVFMVCVWAAFDPAVRRLSSIAAAISMLSFLLLWWQAGQPSALRTIAIADGVGLIPLGLVLFSAWR